MKNFSCSFERLYASGGFYDDGAMSDALVDIGDACRWVANLYPAYGYSRPAPVELISTDVAFVDEVAQQCARWDREYTRGASTDLFVLENGLLFNRCLYNTYAGEIVQMYETNRPGDRPWRPDLDPQIDLAAIKQPHDPELDFFYLGSIGSENYGHFLVDDLSRARSLLVHFAADRRPVIVLNKHDAIIDAIRAETLVGIFAGIGELRLIFVDYRAAYFFPRLYFVSPASLHPFLKCPRGVAFLREHLVEGAQRSVPASEHARAPAGQRLFVTRRALWRNVLNLDEVIAYFRARSFDIVELGGRSFSDQVQTFAHAEVIVGVMGAGMTNTVLSPSGATVVHLAPRGWNDPFFWDLAAVKDQRYAVVFGEPWKPEVPSVSSFTIDLARLADAEHLFG
jgi:hypothetical protein